MHIVIVKDEGSYDNKKYMIEVYDNNVISRFKKMFNSTFENQFIRISTELIFQILL